MFVQTWIDLLAINNLVLFCFTGICHGTLNLYSCWEYEKNCYWKITTVCILTHTWSMKDVLIWDFEPFTSAGVSTINPMGSWCFRQWCYGL